VWQDLRGAGLGDIWKKLPQFTGGNFEAWCWRVLRNCGSDLRRKERRVRTHSAGHAAPQEPDFRPVLEAALDRTDLFSQEDLLLIRGWAFRVRVLLLSLSGLYVKLRGEWRGWLQQYDAENPFPFEMLDACDDPGARQSLFAGWLGVSTNLVPGQRTCCWTRRTDFNPFAGRTD
jgi:hypothetical protein